MAFDQLAPENWRDFRSDVIASRRRAGQGARAFSLGAWLGAVGPVLALAELFGGNRRSGIGAKAGGPDYLLQFVEPHVVSENTMRHGIPVE